MASKAPEKGPARWATVPAFIADKKKKPIRMAEPAHRKVPRGASTGASIRGFELSPLQMVKEICLFYVKKCSGRYEDNKAAARYVHQMSSEIITQLSGVAGEIKRNKGEPELYQALLDEWNENFPPALGIMGSPKAIAALVASQSSEMEDLRCALEGEVSKREKDVTEILRSMDAQLQAYKSSVISERRHQHLVENRLREDHELALEEERRKYAEDLDRVVTVQAMESKQHASQVEQGLRDAEANVAKLTAQLEDNVKRHTADVEAVVRSKDKQCERLTEKYGKLKGQYMELISHLNEEFSVLSSSAIEDDDDDEEEEESITSEGTISQETRLHQEKLDLREVRRQNEIDHRQKREQREQREAAKEARRLRKEELLEKLRASPVGKVSDGFMVGGEVKISGAAKGGDQRSEVFTALKAQVEKISQECKEAREKAEACAKKVGHLSRENDLYKKRTEELALLNESLRRALGASVGARGVLESESVRMLQPAQVLLCHTPHFLGTDKHGLMGRVPKLSAYNTPGRF